jgi:WD40 repeat protein
VTALSEEPAASTHHTVVDAENPWPGLESFREADAPFFRGREQDADALLRLVRRERLTVLFGLSGLGKSSLLQAGLFPRLRTEGMLPVYVRVVHDEDARHLRTHVLGALAAAAATDGVDAPPMNEHETLWEHFHRAGAGYWNHDNQLVTPVLVFDQFEEAFTHGATPARAARTAAFLEEFGDLIEERPPRALHERIERRETDARAYDFSRHQYRVVISVRADFLGDLEPLKERVPSIGRNRYRLEPLWGRAALSVTAAGGEALVAPEVGERIVRLVAGEEMEHGAEAVVRVPLERLVVDPSLLSLFCRELNERRKRQLEDRETIGADLVAGSRNLILSEFFERSVADLDARVRAFVEDRMLTKGGHRNSVSQDDALAMDGINRYALDALVRRRLLRREERNGRPWLELTHDVLTGVVRRSREAREETQRLELLEREARERAEGLAREAGEREQALVAARRAARRARRVAMLVGGLALVATALGVIAWLKTVEANENLMVAARASGSARAAQRGAEAAQLKAEAAEAIARARSTEADSQRVIAEEQRSLAQEQRSRAELEAQLANRSVALSEFRAAVQAVENAGERFTALAWLAQSIRRDSSSASGRAFILALLNDLRPRTLLLRQSGSRAAAFSAAGQHVIAVATDGSVQSWDLPSGAKLGGEWRTGINVNSAAFSRDGKVVATAMSDLSVQVWDAITGAKIGPALRGRDDAGPAAMLSAVTNIALSPDGQRVVIASRNGSAQIRDVRTGAEVGTALRHRETARSSVSLQPGSPEFMRQLNRPGDWVNSAAFSPDGQRVVTGAGDSTARVWDANTGAPVGPIVRPGASVNGTSFSPDGRYIITTSAMGAQIWDARTATPLGSAMRPGGTVVSASFSPDGQRVVTASTNGAQIWDAQTGTAIGSPFWTTGGVRSAIFSTNGQHIVATSSIGTEVWDTRSSTPLGATLRLNSPARSVAFSPDGQRIVTALSDSTVRIWNAVTGAQIGSTMRLDAQSSSAAFSADGQRVLTTTSTSNAQVWDAHTGAPILRVTQPTSSVTGAAFSADGQRVVMASITGRNAGTAQVLDVRTSAPSGPTMQLTDVVTKAAFSPDGRRLVMASFSGAAQVWDVRTGTALGPPIRDGGANVIAFSPDGGRVLIGSVTRAQVWDAETSKPMGPAVGAGLLSSVAFSPEGHRIVTTSRTGTARVWDARTGAGLGAQFRPGGALNAPAVGGATTSNPQIANLPIAGPPGSGPPVNAVAFSPDGQRLVTASDDGTVQIWPAFTASAHDARDLAELAEAVAATRLDETAYSVVPLEDTESNRRIAAFRARAERTRGTAPDARSLDAFLQWYFGVAGQTR